MKLGRSMESIFVFSLVLCCILLVNSRDLRQDERSTFNRHDGENCGYTSCNPVKDDMINVHVVPHTHDDVGWLVTVDQYYYQRVQYILDSVIPELVKDPSKRFIYVEIAFFARWYREQDDAIKIFVRELVNKGQLEFILGGWSMNDEASTHYNAIIDQHTLGFEFLRMNFGKCAKPRVGWQIDPFGHSRETASLFAQFGFDSLFFGRLDYQDKINRENTTTMEMIWRGSPDNLGTTSDLFTGVNQDGYGPPPGFCFDIGCGDPEIVDDDRLHDVNVEAEVNGFLSAMAFQYKHYTTNHLMVTMGSDFQYQAAHNWFNNLDKLIKYVNARQANGSKVNLLYSTPSCYTYQVNKANKTWTTKKDDFFPYAHQPFSFWTGYFTSRAALKGYARRVNNFYQSVKQLDVLALLEDEDDSATRLNILAEALGVVQHHDGISGTEKQVVAYDYAERLANGVTQAQKVYNSALKKLRQQQGGEMVEQSFCPLLNISVCPFTSASGQGFQVTLYNPVVRLGFHYVRVPIAGDDTTSYTITGPDGKETVEYEIVPISPDDLRIPERKNASAKYELVFPANLPALGWSVYTVALNKDPSKAKSKIPTVERKPLVGGEDIVIRNEFLSVAFDGNTGMLKNMSNHQKGISISLTQTYAYYKGFVGNGSKAEFQASGAYIFRPNGSTPIPVTEGRAKLSVKSYFEKGEFLQVVYQEFSPWVTQQVKLYSRLPYVEIQWTVGPLSIDDNIGKEVVSIFETNLQNEKVFYTDANGREILKRELNHRDTWTFNNTEPVAGNYYPVNSRIYIRDASKQIQFTVATDRSQGGSSLREGEVELMVHRRLLCDDQKGVGEPLNETGSDGKGLIVRGSHYLMLDPVPTAQTTHRILAQNLYMAPQLSFALGAPQKEPGLWWSGVRQVLPENIHLLTLEKFLDLGPTPTQDQTYLLRLEHFFEKGEDPKLSQPVTLDLETLFTTFNITNAVELTLGGDMPLEELNRLQWSYPQEEKDPSQPTKRSDSLKFVSDLKNSQSLKDLHVKFNPMQIRTFQISIAAI